MPLNEPIFWGRSRRPRQDITRKSAFEPEVLGVVYIRWQTTFSVYCTIAILREQPEMGSTSLTHEAYQMLRADILACRLKPGERLKVDDLGKRLDFSLGAVREALSRLTAEGLVISEAQKGFRVVPVSAEDLKDLTTTRIEIEELCLRRAIAHGDIEWETHIVAAFHRLSKTPERVEGDEKRLNDDWVVAHRQFHSALLASCNSRWLLRLHDILYAQSERYRRLSVPAARADRDIEAEHLAIMQAVLDRDADKAVSLMQKHLMFTSSLLTTFIQPAEPETSIKAGASAQSEKRGGRGRKVSQDV